MLHAMDSIGNCQKTIVEKYPAGPSQKTIMDLIVGAHSGSSSWNSIMERKSWKLIVEEHPRTSSLNGIMEKSVPEEYRGKAS